MSEQGNTSLKPPTPFSIFLDGKADDNDNLRLLSRSPHPYQRQNSELLEPSAQLVYRRASSILSPIKSNDPHNQLASSPNFTKDSTPTSDSGTDADDEHFLKGLPAPKGRPHKGLRGKNESVSGSSTPLLTPSALENEVHDISLKNKREPGENVRKKSSEVSRRRKEVIRRLAELFIVAGLERLVNSDPDAKRIASSWRPEIRTCGAVLLALLALYPVRVVFWAHLKRRPSKWIPLSIPPSFDPAPVLYPPALPLFVSLLVARGVPNAVLPALILSISSIPRSLILFSHSLEDASPSHWLLSCLPLICYETTKSWKDAGGRPDMTLSREVLVLLYPLHHAVSLVLYHLTTTSLLPAELQLLTTSLLSLLMLAGSPQAQILKALLWIGGLGITVLCGSVVKNGIALARVPKWRFRRASISSKRQSICRMIINLLPLRVKYELLRSETEDSSDDASTVSSDEDEVGKPLISRVKSMLPHMDPIDEDGKPFRRGSVQLSPRSGAKVDFAGEEDGFSPPSRRHTLPVADKGIHRSKTHTPSGRRKRSASSSVRKFFSLTQAQATVRKWFYAVWVYLSIITVILVLIRDHVQRFALYGNEPVGWAVGYLFGDLPWFRFQVVNANLERWICLPTGTGLEIDESCHLGWIQHLRQASFGEANTRLLLSAYWLAVIVVGLAVVFKLSPVYEVDTRRKVFHFMMVAMFLPATYVDPTWCGLALSIALAIFMLLDLLRASQLPPLSKPIASFLTPYVDGRDLRGPVVISHIFLLIGCAIPMWLSLASLPRTGTGCLQGWEVPTREVSMITGVVCVGLGDAAASLIGRRYGHHKWLWGGGKSLEGSVAFALAVFAGLAAANIWLKIGGWPSTNYPTPPGAVGTPTVDAILSSLQSWDWGTILPKTALCATTASLTEAVLTGGNDNVVVPVVLWTCVKSLGI